VAPYLAKSRGRHDPGASYDERCERAALIYELDTIVRVAVDTRVRVGARRHQAEPNDSK
jgi:hypothetical protein